jgi:hypothetical protein
MPSVLGKISARFRQSWLVQLCALVILLLSVPEPALAGTCTTDASGNFDCSGTFVTNINNNANITLEPGVIVISPGGGAVNAANSTAPGTFGADVTITANNANVTNTSSPGTANNTGLRIQSAGAATITASGEIDVLGTASDDAILAIIEGDNPAGAPRDVTVKYGVLNASGQVIPRLVDQDPWAQLRRPMDMIRQG